MSNLRDSSNDKYLDLYGRKINEFSLLINGNGDKIFAFHLESNRSELLQVDSSSESKSPNLFIPSKGICVNYGECRIAFDMNDLLFYQENGRYKIKYLS